MFGEKKKKTKKIYFESNWVKFHLSKSVFGTKEKFRMKIPQISSFPSVYLSHSLMKKNHNPLLSHSMLQNDQKANNSENI